VRLAHSGGTSGLVQGAGVRRPSTHGQLVNMNGVWKQVSILSEKGILALCPEGQFLVQAGLEARGKNMGKAREGLSGKEGTRSLLGKGLNVP